MSADGFVSVPLAPFQRALWAATREGRIPPAVRDSLLRVRIDSDKGTGKMVRITEAAATDLGVTTDHLGRRLKPFQQIGIRQVAQPWLFRTHAPTRPNPETGQGRRALYRLQAPADLVPSNGIATPTDDV